MKTFDLTAAPSGLVPAPVSGARVAVLLDQGQSKVRRIELDAGGTIPPCHMRDDVVFVVLRGSVLVTAGTEEETVAAPGAAYIPGDATTRSLRALEPSLMLAVLSRGAHEDPPAANA
jgi:quercetin dioxygenase-like cupin family protein